MTAAQHEQVPEDEEITAADRLIVESPTPTGLIAIRAMAPEPGLMRWTKRSRGIAMHSANRAGTNQEMT